MSDHTLHVGDDGETQFLLRVYDDGEHELSTRPLAGGTRTTWSPPTILNPEPAA